jgi:hypothetical protein
MASAHPLTDHDEIRAWAEERGGKPSCVKGTGGGEDVGMIRLDFPGYSGEDSLAEISWDEWFQKFDDNGLALLVQDETAGGERSNFNKLVSRETAAESANRRKSASRSRSASGRTTAKTRATAKTKSAARGKSGASKSAKAPARSTRTTAAKSSRTTRAASAKSTKAAKTTKAKATARKSAAGKSGGARTARSASSRTKK